MHGGEGEDRRRKRHMRPDPLRSATTVANSSLSEGAYFCKDGRKISVGDCALFQAEGSPPFIGIIRRLTTNTEDYTKLAVNWLYRPADVKLKGFLSAPNEVFYSFHRDEISAAFLLHPCKVAFLRKGVELPPGISSFVCRRVYDTTNKRLWWLTDKDYINEWQEEVDQLLDKTWEEMYAEGRSPKPLNSPVSSQQLKSGSDSVPSSVTSFPSQVKGKKREQSDQGLEPVKRERSFKTDDAESGYSRFDNMMKSEITKITDKEGSLVTLEGVEKLVQLMQPDRNEKKIDLPGRIMLANVISATDRLDCLSRFVQLRGLPVLDDWLQEAHKGKVGDNNSPKEGDKGVEELLLALLRALDKLPVNLLALQSCNIGKSVNHLRNHKNLDIHKKAKSLVDTWKKRVEAEMKSNDAKSGSTQGDSWPGKSSFSEVSHDGGKHSGSSDVLKGTVSQPTATKTASSKFGHGDSVAKSASASPSSGKLSLPASATTGSKDSFSKAAVTSGVSDPPLPTIKEEKSSSSSQSQNNSQSYSSDHAKVAGSAWKEDAKSSTAGSVNAKASGGSSRHRKSSNGFLGSSASQKETGSTKLGSVYRNQTFDKVSQSGVASERATDALLGEHANSQRLIVRLPNPGRSPAQSLSGGSLEDIAVIGSRASSPVVSEKHDHAERKLKGKSEMSRSNAAPDVNNESWQSNDVKHGLNGSDEGDRSPTAAFDEERVRNCEDISKTLDISKATCSSSGNEKCVLIPETKYVKSYDTSFSSMNALIESCVKYSEIPVPLCAGDDLGMNLLASVAAGEISKSDTVSPSASSGRDSLLQEDSNNGKESKSRSSHDHIGSHDRGQLDESEDDDSEKQGNDAASSKVEEGPAVTRDRSHTEDGKTGNDRIGKSCGSVELHGHEDLCARPEGNCAAGGLPVEPSGTETGKSSPVRATESPVAEEHKQGSDRRKRSINEEDTNGFIEVKKKPKSPLISEKVTLEGMHGNILSVSVGMPEVGPHTTTCDGSDFTNAMLNHVIENKTIEEPLSNLPMETNAADDKHEKAEDFDGEVSNEEKLLSIAEHAINNDNDEDVTLPCSNTTACPDDSDKLKPGDIDKLKPGNATVLEDKSVKEPSVGENVEQARNQFDFGGGGTDAKMGESEVANKNDTGEDEKSEKKATTVDQHIDALTSEGKASSGPVQDTEGATAKSVRADVPSAAGSSSLEAVAVDSASKLCFDLNEGFPSDDANQDEPISAGTASVSPAVCQPSSVPIPVPKASSGISASITVTSAAKGPFILPDNMLRNKGDIRWKGSAATSAFRRAEPQRVLEALASNSEVPSSETSAGKFGRPPLDIDLNEPDERVLEDVPTRHSVAQVYGSVSGMKTVESKLPTSSACGAGRLDLDLNRAEEGPENGQMAGISNRRAEVPVSSARPSSSSGGLSNGDHAPRNFDLNDGPSLDEGADPGPYYSHPKSNASYLPPVANLRMNELGNLSSWFPPGGSYSQVSIPPFMSDRVEQPYSIVATAAGVQRILGPTSGGPAGFGADIYRAPVLSSSPAMGFTAPSAFPYGGFPLGGGFPLASASFTSSTFIESSSGGGPCFPPIASQLVGPGATVSATYGRPYLISHPYGPGGESSRKRPRQGLDLNAGPGSIDTDGRDERFISAWQIPVANSQALAEEQTRLYQAAGGTALKRKEPEGGWDADRFGYKQPAWQ